MNSTSQKINEGNFFEDFSIGQEIFHATPRTITNGDSALYIALTGSRHPIASASTVAESLGYLSQPIDDLLAFHIAFGKTVPEISVNAIANLGYANVRFINPVYPNDTLYTKSTIIGLKENSNKKSGIVYVQSNSFNQKNEEIISWIRWVMVHKKNMSFTPQKNLIPDLPESVVLDKLPIPSFFNGNAFNTRWTKSDNLWEHYKKGEVIYHPSGMTVSDTDHTLATKLYQNNARLHFDDFMMKKTSMGKRLIYGGHVISVCKNLSYDGLENSLAILAINGGTHSNPTFGNDTLYASTEILDKWEIPYRSDIGVLRLRLIGYKNMELDAFKKLMPIENKNYHEHIVLDLDYSILMPRKKG
ncbi:MAG TPA: hypothetical protein DD612_00560 [Methylophilaceae bacterium]|jgi:2-methylfumaryl-CoA hydratase|nr:hypothetical protein [Methylophilaceae bacterium]